MNAQLTPFALLAARILMAPLFLVSGLGKLGAIAATQAYMEAMHVPAILFWPTALFEIGSGLLLLVGFGTRALAVLLAGFCLITAFVFHNAFGDQVQQLMFLKNLVMAGGFLVLAVSGAGRFSLDGRRA